MSDTPRTDKATWDVDDCGKPTDRRDGTGYPTGYWVITDFARTLERELSAMQHRAESAEIIAERNIAELAKLNALPLAPAFTREDVETALHLVYFLNSIRNTRIGSGIGGACYCPGPRNKERVDDLAERANALASKIEQAAGGGA